MGVHLVTEGCLDEAIARYLLTLSGANEVKSQIIRGWEKALQYGLEISSEIRHQVIVFIDADSSIDEKLEKARSLLEAEGNTLPGWENLRDCRKSACSYKIPVGEDGKRSLVIVFWADPDSEEPIRGSVEDVLRHALREAYSCELKDAIHALAGSCNNCPATLSRVLRTQEKLLPILVMLACSGGGTLVFTEAHYRCGFNVHRAMTELDKLRQASSFQNYVELLREVLSP